jgi:hypothetical protein
MFFPQSKIVSHASNRQIGEPGPYIYEYGPSDRVTHLHPHEPCSLLVAFYDS